MHLDASQGCVCVCAPLSVWFTCLTEWCVEGGCGAVCRAIKAGPAPGSELLKFGPGRTFMHALLPPDMHIQYRPTMVHKLLRAYYVQALFCHSRFSSEHTDKPCAHGVYVTPICVCLLSVSPIECMLLEGRSFSCELATPQVAAHSDRLLNELMSHWDHL